MYMYIYLLKTIEIYNFIFFFFHRLKNQSNIPSSLRSEFGKTIGIRVF